MVFKKSNKVERGRSGSGIFVVNNGDKVDTPKEEDEKEEDVWNLLIAKALQRLESRKTLDDEDTIGLLEGRRIVDSKFLVDSLRKCNACELKLDLSNTIKEMRHGYASTLIIQCSCGAHNRVDTGKNTPLKQLSQTTNPMTSTRKWQLQ